MDLFAKAMEAYDRADRHSLGIEAVINLIQANQGLTAEQLRPRDAEHRRYEYGEAGGGWPDAVLMEAPESWDGDDAAEHIALSYVATLEARLDAAGISREKWVE